MNDKELSNYLKNYLDKGFYLFPLTKTRIPFEKGVKDYASNSIRQINKWIKQYPKCNWGVWLAKGGLVAVDVDTDERYKGMERWTGYIFEEGEPHTMKQVSARGGFHYIFRAGGHRFRKNLDGKLGIDVKHNGYIALKPSINEKNGKGYEWENGFETEIADVPEWLLPLITQPKREIVDQGPLGVTSEEFPLFEALCEEISQKQFGHDDWVGLGMAIHHEFPGAEGRELFEIITHGVNFNPGDDELADIKWASFKDDKDQNRTIKSLIWDARYKFGITISRELHEWLHRTEGIENTGWFVDPSDREVTVHKDFLVEWMNERYTFMDGEPANVIVKHETEANGIKNATTLKTDGFHLKFKNKFYKFYDYSTSPPKPKYKPASEVWIESRSRSTHSKIVFRPACEPGELNLWSDIPYQPVEGDVAPFIELCEQVFANGNKAKGKWLMQWLAHIVQQPDVKSTLVPVLIGDQGTGKGLLADGIMSKMLGPFYSRITQSAEFKEKFNKSHSKKFFTFIDEATWRGDKTEDGILKSLTGSAVMTVEEKFGARYTIENYSRYLIASNNPDAVAIERSNRRYMVFHVNNSYHQKSEFFTPFWDAVNNGDMVGRILHFLKSMDLSDFNPFVLPRFDNDSNDAKIATEGVVAQFWNDLLNENPKAVFFNGNALAKDFTYKAFGEFHSETKSWEKGISRMVFWKKTIKLIPILQGRESRTRSDNAHKTSYRVTPFELFSSFCSTMTLEAPVELDDLDYVLENSFNEN